MKITDLRVFQTRGGHANWTFVKLYPAGGGNLAECIAFGRIAAENAVKER